MMMEKSKEINQRKVEQWEKDETYMKLEVGWAVRQVSRRLDI